MTFFIPKIQLSRLYKNELEVFKMLDKAPYGKELAGKVAHKLTNKNISSTKTLTILPSLFVLTFCNMNTIGCGDFMQKTIIAVIMALEARRLKKTI